MLMGPVIQNWRNRKTLWTRFSNYAGAKIEYLENKISFQTTVDWCISNLRLRREYTPYIRTHWIYNSLYKLGRNFWFEMFEIKKMVIGQSPNKTPNTKQKYIKKDVRWRSYGNVRRTNNLFSWLVLNVSRPHFYNHQ